MARDGRHFHTRLAIFRVNGGSLSRISGLADVLQNADQALSPRTVRKKDAANGTETTRCIVRSTAVAQEHQVVLPQAVRLGREIGTLRLRVLLHGDLDSLAVVHPVGVAATDI